MSPALLLSVLLAAAPASDVSEVVVFPQGAEVTRVQPLTCAPGRTAHFPGLPLGLRPDAVRARLQAGTGEVLSVRVASRQVDVAPGPEHARVQQELRALELRDGALAETRALAEREQQLGTHYARVVLAKVTRALLLPGASPRTWGQALDAGLDAALAGARKRGTVEEQAEALAERRAALEARQAELEAAAQRFETEAVVEVACAAGAALQVALTYRVQDAGWTPAYEARADEPGKVVELTALADVRQATGEAWAGARLVLSTAVPQAEATPPELQVLHVAARPRAREQRVLTRREEEAQQAGARGEGRVADAAVEGLDAQAQGLSVRLQVPGRVSVPADGRVTRLVVGRARLPATFALRAVPRLSAGAYRVADVVNTAPFPLLPGPVELFRASGLAGRAELERVAQGAPVTLTFGPEEEVRVARVVVEEVQRKTGLLGGTRRFRYAYRVEAANYGGREETLEVVETVPVPEVEDVRVVLDAEATAPSEHDVDTGRLTYRLGLPAGGAARSVEVGFFVEVPASWDPGGGP